MTADEFTKLPFTAIPFTPHCGLAQYHARWRRSQVLQRPELCGVS
jgi:hypothetical protein